MKKKTKLNSYHQLKEIYLDVLYSLICCEFVLVVGCVFVASGRFWTKFVWGGRKVGVEDSVLVGKDGKS